jgi:hypothetical protein
MNAVSNYFCVFVEHGNECELCDGNGTKPSISCTCNRLIAFCFAQHGNSWPKLSFHLPCDSLWWSFFFLVKFINLLHKRWFWCARSDQKISEYKRRLLVRSNLFDYLIRLLSCDHLTLSAKSDDGHANSFVYGREKNRQTVWTECEWDSDPFERWGNWCSLFDQVEVRTLTQQECICPAVWSIRSFAVHGFAKGNMKRNQHRSKHR